MTGSDGSDGNADYHGRIDPHRRASRLSDIVLGGQDGLVNVLGVILGIGAATSDGRLVLVAGLAAALAESISMAAVAYTSRHTDRAVYESESARERRHVRLVPQLERDEVREIFRGKGFSGELLERITETITANSELWVTTMMAEEHRLAPVPRRAPLVAAAVVGGAALVGSLIPLLPFFFLRGGAAMIAACVVSAVVLFATGVYKARTTIGHWLRGGLEMMTIGMLAAAAGYALGRVLHVTAP